MKVEVEIISREDIRPSSPTPSHLRIFKLSILDQLIATPYAPVILFYTSPGISKAPNMLELLKQSLSLTLTEFYPLGGKINGDELFIDCNDEGVNFVEAKANCPISKFLINPDLTLLLKFLPTQILPEGSSTVPNYVTNIQVNVFDCGGIAIGMCISHRIIDGAALGTFLKEWTERARSCNQSTHPNFTTSSLFPTSSSWFRDSSKGMWGPLFKQGNSITRRFLFTNSAIATLKAQIISSNSSSCVVKDPTRVEIVSSMMWKCLMGASKAQLGTKRPSMVTHLVNFRKRIGEALRPHENAMGNFLWLVAAEDLMSSEHELLGLDELVCKLRNAISRIDKGFVENLKGVKGSSIMQESLRKISETWSKDEVETFAFSSWCNLGFYEADFGWGGPTWVSSIAPNITMFMNMVILVDTKLKDGIEAWVTLDEKKMTHLESSPELLTYATLDPSPLAIGGGGGGGGGGVL